MAQRTEVAVIGAGPYGLSAAAHLREAGHDVQVFGEPLRFWRTQTPMGMLLRSPYHGSNIGDPKGALTLQDYERDNALRVDDPITADDFVDYGIWFQERAVPDVDERGVATLEQTAAGFRLQLDDGDPFEAQRVVVAAGVGALARRPPQFGGLDPDQVSHSLDHRDLSCFAGRRVSVVGGGQSALESAALLHESGADVDVLVRAPEVRFLGAHPWTHRPPHGPLLYAPADVGPAGISQLVAHPAAYRRLPRRLQDRWAPRAIRPAGARWLVDRLQDVAVHTGTEVTRATPTAGGVRLQSRRNGTPADDTVDHVLLATGYQVDLDRYTFLPPDVTARITRVGGYPRLSRRFETSVRGLHILGAPAAWSFGPLMRFVAGSDFAARALTGGLGT